MGLEVLLNAQYQAQTLDLAPLLASSYGLCFLSFLACLKDKEGELVGEWKACGISDRFQGGVFELHGVPVFGVPMLLNLMGNNGFDQITFVNTHLIPLFLWRHARCIL